MITCECCGGRITQKALNAGYSVNGRRISGVYECSHCSAVLGQCYKGDSYSIVLPTLSAPIEGETEIYFDLVVVGSDGVSRRHGWFSPSTRRLTQVG